MTWVWKGLRRARALRAITPAWCWDNLNRFDNFGSFNKAVNKIGYFSEYLRSNGGSRRVPPFDSAVSVVQRLRPSDVGDGAEARSLAQAGQRQSHESPQQSAGGPRKHGYAVASRFRMIACVLSPRKYETTAGAGQQDEHGVVQLMFSTATR